MAKKQPTPVPDDGTDDRKPKKYSVVIDPDLVKKIKFLAADAEVSPPDWINNQLRRDVDREWPRILDELGE